ncbi:cytochrome c biogenesis protein CcdA [Rhizobium ruizarguesonis]|jgi:cytochrome c biogenesis protein CcdA|uniref:Cytochrome c biogenesis protein CcdA n=1 Tax=Rhizobium ruizarguesonis TaxID=2081791 RepID=A0ABY1X568_9HYPH|nr:cytochrome c biogenesis protein CcdA [Rhizobium ruizarguesonis]TAU75381.1 cytochrome c biogenesis protein CcdA [Rhizobium ruizarguesonis]TAV14794.1 cytochrome c biogenesis protein CcdA [Rhizobium ruizarguesonis]TAV27256.1 cytochrome c biogenesis protein CcdA [Rhizobium ruizarguesonis]TAV31723.1 cytochrome c biogenesis protein CcdA [Rhizobium ruizarguesonis]TAV36487.1 cytochrome c biogenesis protein CcdA [Rhizobium ruizarguesonis]
MLLALLAGILSILSPCVLPLVPVVLTGAVAEHRLAPLALAAGVALSFTAIGLFVATIGFSIGLDMTVFRTGAAVLLVVVGAVLVVPRLQVGFATAAGPVSNWAQSRFSGLSTSGISGQFGVGLLLGAVWTPCVGPTLGAASIMAARGENLGMVALTMMAFGIGTALPLLLLSALSREALLRWRGYMMSTASGLKMALGVLLILAGAMTLTGFDRTVQAALLDALPSWMLSLTTAI